MERSSQGGVKLRGKSAGRPGIKIPRGVNTVLRRAGVVSAYVFGSRVRGECAAGSDLDIAVRFSSARSNHQTFRRRLELIRALSLTLKCEVDLVVLDRDCPLFLQHVILSTGRCFFCSDKKARMEYDLRLMSEYFDFAPFLQEYNRHYVQRHS